MPEYLFVNDSKPSETSLRVYHMNEAPSVGTTIVDLDTGIKWKRVFTKPQAAIDTQCDPHSVSDFVKVTNRKDTIGSLWDRSAEMSERRAAKDGKDFVKEGFYDNYAKKRKGRQHPQRMREEGARRLKAKGITVDFGDQ